jgi:hypothetical protein
LLNRRRIQRARGLAVPRTQREEVMRTNLVPILALALAMVAAHVLAPGIADAHFRWPPQGSAPEIGADAIGGAIALVTGALALLGRRR